MQLAPDIFEFDDHRTYMDAWYAWKKQTNPKYSHRLFARRAGRAGDAGLLRNLITGRRALTRALVTDVGVALELTSVEVDYLGMLAELDKVRGSDREPSVRAKLEVDPVARRELRRRLRLEQYLTVWYVPVVRELARVQPFTASAEWIAERVVPPITVDEASVALTILHDLGQIDADGRFVQRADDEWSRDRAPHETISYQQGLHATAGRALAQVAEDPQYRDASTTEGVVMAVPRNKLGALQAELAAVQQRLTEMATTYEDPNTVVQIVLQAFPVVAEPQT